MNQEATVKKKNIFAKDPNFSRLLAVLIIVFVVASLMKGTSFLNSGNFESMMKQFPEYGLLSIGIGMALMIGGIDLSAVYLANLSAIIGGKFLLAVVNENTSATAITGYIIISFIICLIIGALGGVLNGVLISGLGIPAMLATLGTQSLFWGLGVVLTGGSTMSGFPTQLAMMMNTTVGIVPVTVFIFIAGAVIAGILVSKTVFGRQMKMYGTNNKATVFVGINNFKVVVLTHMVSGILAAMAGIIMWGRYSSAKADTGSTYTTQGILIAVLGGVSPNGGKGNVQGIVVAILIIQMLSSTLNMFPKIPTACRQIVWGGLLLVVMIVNFYIEQNAKKIKH